jgi:hypothetical protein
MAGTLDEKTALGEWKARMTGRGVATSPDLIAGFAAIPDIESREGKLRGNDLAEQAQERAGASTKRTLGTAIHSFTEQLDGEVDRTVYVPEPLVKVIGNYRTATADVRWLAIEMFLVQDAIKVAGTTDRIGQRPGQQPRVWDLKTGRVDYGQLKFAIQLAIYARSRAYDPRTGHRAPIPNIDLEIGHIIHADPLTAEVTVYDVDLDKGWRAAQLARTVYDWRRDRELMWPRRERLIEDTTALSIAAAATLDDLVRLYRDHDADWTAEHRTMASERAKALRGGRG